MSESERNSKKTTVSFSVRLVRQLSQIIDRVVIIILLLLCAYGIYGIWDTNQLLSSAQASNLQQYKPKEDDLSFQELKRLNPEVIAWLTVYGTKIDYPITQADNNQKYVNTNVMGDYSLAGSLFLTSENAADFSDFNNIIYGHHMDKEAMFGGLDRFQQKQYFNQHQYGNLFYEGNDYGIEFFAFIRGDAYDWRLYDPGIQEPAAREAYLTYLLEKASQTRDLKVSGNDRIVLLSTCASEPTNGRHIFVGKLHNTPFKDPFYKKKEKRPFLGIDVQNCWKKIQNLPRWPIILLSVIWLIVLLRVFLKKKFGRRGKPDDE